MTGKTSIEANNTNHISTGNLSLPYLQTNFKCYDSNSLLFNLSSSRNVKTSGSYGTGSTVTDPYCIARLELPQLSCENSVILPNQPHHFSQQALLMNIPPIVQYKNLNMFNTPLVTAATTDTSVNRYNTRNPVISNNISAKTKKHETVLCLKRLFTFLLSHVGLAILVIIYTLIGGSMFYTVERDHESHIKMKMSDIRKKLINELMSDWRNAQLEVLETLVNSVNIIHQFEQTKFGSKLKNQINIYDSIERLAITNNQNYSKNNSLKDEQRQHLAGLAWYLSSLGWPKRILPQWWFYRNYTQLMLLKSNDGNNNIDMINSIHRQLPDEMMNSSTDQKLSTTNFSPVDPHTGVKDLPRTDSRLLQPIRTTTGAPRITSPSYRINSNVELINRINQSVYSHYFAMDIVNTLPKHLVLLTKLDDILPIIINKSYALEVALQRRLIKYVEQIVIAIKDEGWNGSEHTDDLNWTFEGSILFAVTIITTIGYGHVTPHTSLGKFLTMMYALFGIPLFFCYLSNSGNYMASIFQVFYVRICQPALVQCKKCFKQLSHKKLKKEFKLSQNDNIHICGNNSQSSYAPKYERYKRTLGNTTHNTCNSSSSSSITINSNYLHQPYLSTSTTNPNQSENLNLSDTDQQHMLWNGKQSQTSSSILSSIKQDYLMEHVTSTSPYLKTQYCPPHLLDLNEISAFNPHLRQYTPMESFNLSSYYSNTAHSMHDQSSKGLIASNLDLPITSMNLLKTSQQFKQQNDLDICNTSMNESNQSSLEKSKTVPLTLTILMMTVYILLGAAVFCFWESTDYLKWSYFCFVTLSTIGFGDIVPGTKIDSQNPKEKMIALALYVALGLSLFAMCFNLMEEEVTAKLKGIGKRLGVTKSSKRKSKS
ncbi:unnamed protein product [Heterobilharzia americana]|nr:unnamed protein product [Heterobilharzia americana]